MTRRPRSLAPAIRTAVVLAAAGVALVAAVEPAAACPTCKLALASHDRAQGDLVSGFFWSILFMLSMPFAITGSLGTYFYLLVRRARAMQSAGAAPGTEGGPADPCDSTGRHGAATLDGAASLEPASASSAGDGPHSV